MSERAILVTAVGEAGGSKSAAAALACAGSEPDRAGLLIDVGGRAPRPTLVSSAGARELEERLAVHLPRFRAASRGQVCHLALPADRTALEPLRAALPLVRDSVSAIHLPPALLREVLAEDGIRPSGALLCADLAADRALTALAARDLIDRGLRVAVLKQALGWVPARRALFGVLPDSATGGLPARLLRSLLESENPVEHTCYAGDDNGQDADPAGTSQQQRRGDEGTRPGRGFHRHPQREAGR